MNLTLSFYKRSDCVHKCSSSCLEYRKEESEKGEGKLAPWQRLYSNGYPDAVWDPSDADGL